MHHFSSSTYCFYVKLFLCSHVLSSWTKLVPLVVEDLARVLVLTVRSSVHLWYLNYFNMLISVYNCKSLGILMQSANSHGGQYYCNIMQFAIVTSQVCKITRYY
jgi:hypothetical protein